MSSLVTTASVWTNDDSLNKKRQSTMRKTIKMRSPTDDVGDSDEYTLETEKYRKSMPSTIEEHETNTITRNNRVNDLLNKITSADTSSDNNKLGDFTPINPPSINVKKDIGDNTEIKTYTPPPSYLTAQNDRKSGSTYGVNNMKDSVYSNYQQSYVPTTQPYYAKMGITTGQSNQSDNKLMEKINYMIHLLEEKQLEKTNNITEEFILYTFLGVFIIFIVDSFSKSGKYVR